MSKIAIISDSASTIPTTLRNRYHIFQVNDPIIFGDEVYKETVDIQGLGALVKMMKEKKMVASTSQPAPGDWEQALNDAKAAGYDAALIVPISSGLSGAFQTAQAVAASYDGMADVRAWDSKFAVMGSGMQAVMAAVMAEKGQSLDDIWSALTALRETFDVRFVVNDISHLQRTGRLSRGAALVGGLLNIKPILSMDVQDEGKIGAVGKARKMSGALKEIKTALDHYLTQVDYPVRAVVVDGNDPKLGDKWLKDLQNDYPTVKFERGEIGAYIGVHTGDGAMGVLWARDWETLIGE
ncbi:DegV family protein [Leuconostoc holzapfelii]|uniref:DegV family protein n=1 Tax=Leuconostoc holzapfelii TaxID=434464 RepID=A0ABT2NUQ8_9LACO|nr:DegV family protein [Leuconostoc holzapfelii]MCT8389108.1 DegV family protein [Leuconostoc holzapfelii]